MDMELSKTRLAALAAAAGTAAVLAVVTVLDHLVVLVDDALNVWGESDD